LATAGQILTDVIRANCHVQLFEASKRLCWGTWAIAVHVARASEANTISCLGERFCNRSELV